MGRWLLLWTCAGAWLCGCVSPPRASDRDAQRRWEALCRCLGRDVEVQDRCACPPKLAPEQQAALRHAAARVAPSVVAIRTVLHTPAREPVADRRARTTAAESGGVGIIVGADGAILTAEHVVRNAAEIHVVLRDGTTCVAETVRTDPELDLAVLRIRCEPLPALALAPTDVSAGTPVVALGAAFDEARRTGVVTRGAVSLQAQLDPERTRDYSALVETTVTLEPGFSGSPLLDAEGRLVGLNVATSGAAEDTTARAYALPFDQDTCTRVRQLCQP